MLFTPKELQASGPNIKFFVYVDDKLVSHRDCQCSNPWIYRCFVVVLINPRPHSCSKQRLRFPFWMFCYNTIHPPVHTSNTKKGCKTSDDSHLFPWLVLAGLKAGRLSIRAISCLHRQDLWSERLKQARLQATKAAKATKTKVSTKGHDTAASQPDAADPTHPSRNRSTWTCSGFSNTN